MCQSSFILIFQFILGEIFASKCSTFKANNKINPLFDEYFKQKISSNFSSLILQQNSNIFNLSKCACKQDWANSFCSRAEKYSKMSLSLEKAPSICVCRKMIGINKCVQFLSRCFRHNFDDITKGQQKHRPQVLQEKCSCCFNQPDVFCKQLECHQMFPIFEQFSNTSCRCFSPQISTENDQQKIFKTYLNLKEILCENWNGKNVDENEEEKFYSSSSYNIINLQHSTKNENLNNLFYSSAPYARFLSFLLIVFIGSFILAIAACFWSHWRRKHLKKKSQIKLDIEEQINVNRTNQQLFHQQEDENLNKNEENGAIYQEVTV